jgi:Acyl-CoA carboxylase epsilon subunit
VADEARAEATGSVPYLRVVRGDATPEEIAALVATLTAVAAARARSAAAAAPAPVRSDWNSPARRLRAPLSPAPGGWRRSALP